MNNVDEQIRRHLEFLRSNRPLSDEDRRDVRDIVNGVCGGKVREVVNQLRDTDVSDVYQDVMTKVWTQILRTDDWIDSISSPTAWMRSVAYRYTLDLIRNDDEQKRVDVEATYDGDVQRLQDGDSNSEDGDPHESIMDCVRRAFSRLSAVAKYRDGLADWLHYQQDSMTTAELAKRNGIKAGAQRQRISSMGKRINLEMERICPEHWKEYEAGGIFT